MFGSHQPRRCRVPTAAIPRPAASTLQHLRANRGDSARINHDDRMSPSRYAPSEKATPHSTFRHCLMRLANPSFLAKGEMQQPKWRGLRGQKSASADKQSPRPGIMPFSLRRRRLSSSQTPPFWLKNQGASQISGVCAPKRERPTQSSCSPSQNQPEEIDSYRTVPQLLRADLSTQLAASFQRRSQYPVLPPQFIAAPQRKPAARHRASCFARKSLHRILN